MTSARRRRRVGMRTTRRRIGRRTITVARSRTAKTSFNFPLPSPFSFAPPGFKYDIFFYALLRVTKINAVKKEGTTANCRASSKDRGNLYLGPDLCLDSIGSPCFFVRDRVYSASEENGRRRNGKRIKREEKRSRSPPLPGFTPAKTEDVSLRLAVRARRER